MLVRSLSSGIIVLSYYTNTAAYERYCVNKAHPELHCNGKCQMAKKIRAEQERDQKDPLKSFRLSELVISDQHFFPHIDCVCFPEPVAARIFPWSIGQEQTMSYGFFHPPGNV